MRTRNGSWFLMTMLGLSTSVFAAGPEVVAPSNELNPLWRIGTPDRSAAEFALGPGEWYHFENRFMDNPVFIVGRSEPRKAWPYAHPGPIDDWGVVREHAYSIFFGLKSPPKGDCRLRIDLVDTHWESPPKWRIEVNGRPFEHQMPAGATDDSLNGKPGAGRPYRADVIVPAETLRAGNNVVVIRSIAGSWAVYDALSLDVPAGVELAPVTPTATILDAQGLPVLLRADDDDRGKQQVDLTIQYTGTDAKAVVKAGAATETRVRLRPGVQHVGVAAPRVSAPTSIDIHMEVADEPKSTAQARVELKPTRPWRVYLVPHTHVDIGYTDVQAEVAKTQTENLDLAIDLARRTADYPEDARFKWNVEVMWPVDMYLRESSPEKQQALIDAVEAGWIELEALYGNELTGLCRPEELVRLVECGARVSQRCGVPLKTAMISDVPGYTWGIVPVLAQAGVKYFSIGPNECDRIGRTLAEWGDKVFYWRSPSGQERVLCWMANGYSFFHGAFGGGTLGEKGPKRLLAKLDGLERAGYPYEMVQLRYSIGGDNGPPDPNLSNFVRKWNATYLSPHLVISTVTEMLAAFEERYGDRIPGVTGDFTPYWEDGAASSARETALNRETAERLVQAETLFALLAPERFPAADFAEAWRNAILYDEHTWGAWNSISEPDEPFVKDQWRVKQAFALDAARQSQQLLAQTVGMLPSSGAPVAAVDVYNTSSWTRTDLVTLPKGLATVGDAVKDSAGAATPSQRLATGELAFLAKDVPPFASVRYSFSPDAAEGSGEAFADGTTLRTPQIRVRVDAKTGAIVSLRDAAGKELVDPQAAVAVNDYRYMLDDDVAGAKGAGPAKVSVKEAGPLVAALLIESEAPGCRKLTREVRVVSGLDFVELINTVDKLPVREKEGVHFGFAFNVPDGVMRMDIPWAVIRPEVDQLPGACKNWYTVQRWVDVSNADYGVTWAPLDAPLVEVGAMTADRIGSLTDPEDWLGHIAPSQTLYSWAMNNHWHTNYKADQEGPTVFRYVICPHDAFGFTAAQRFGIERSQPLIAAPGTDKATIAGLPFRMDLGPAIVTSLRPGNGGRALLVRLFNPTSDTVRVDLKQDTAASHAIRRCGLFGEADGAPVKALDLPPWGFATLRWERQ